MNVIYYEEALIEYNQALQNTLRGFSPKCDFISSWVPDADTTVSVVSLIEAAFSEETEQFTLVFSTDISNQDYYQSLISRLKEIADFDVVTLDSRSHIKIKNKRVKNTQTSFESNQRFTRRVAQKIDDDTSAVLASDEDIYLDNIEESKKNYQDKNLDEHEAVENSNKQKVTKIEIPLSQGTWQMFVDEDQFVIAIACTNILDSIQQGIFTKANELFVGKPLQDIRDNGLAAVEYALRDNHQHRKMAGIQSHFNFSPLFAELQQAIKTLAKEYTKRGVNNFDIRNNFSLTTAEKSELIRKIEMVSQAFCQALNIDSHIEVSAIDNIARVTVMMSGELPATEKSALLMALEVELRQKVAPEIQLYSTLYEDKNTKRQGHEWAINL